MDIRPATEADRPALIALQLASWRGAYAGLLSEAYLAGPVEVDIASLWTRAPGPGDFRLLAEAGGVVLGFVAVIDKAGAPYVDNLHVAPAARGRGVGRVLMQAAASRLRARGDDRMWLTVMEGNAAALAFYRRIGGVVAAPVPDSLFGQPIHSREVHWPRLDALVRDDDGSGDGAP